MYKLFYSLKQDISQESLVLAAIWCIGEYGEILLQSAPKAGPTDDPADESGANEDVKDVTDKDIVDLLETILEGPYANVVIREYTINALMKLTTRITNPSVLERIRSIIRVHVTDIDIELQQRSVEYNALLTDPALDKIRPGVLERMPVPPPTSAAERRAQRAATTTSSVASPQKNTPGPSSGGGLLDDLLGLDQAIAPTASSSTGAGGDLLSQLGGLSMGAAPTSAAPASGVDLLADVFGTGAPAGLGGPKIASTKNDIMGLFGAPAPLSPSAAMPSGNVMGMGMGAAPTSAAANPLDLLNGLGGLGGGAPLSASVAPAQPSSPLSALSPMSAPSPSGASASTAAESTVYSKNNLQILFKSVAEPGPDAQSSIAFIQILFRNGGPTSITDLNFQVAVPKNLRLQLLPPSSNTVAGNGGTTRQSMKILNPAGKTDEGRIAPLRLRLKVAYAVDGGSSGGSEKVDEVVDFGGFGAGWTW